MIRDRAFAKLMAQATALTRSGRLAEATHALQRAFHLNDKPPSPATAEPASDPIVLDGLVREIDPAAPAEPASTPEPARFEEFSFATLQTQRHYKLFAPAGPADAPRPLVVMLHGCKQNPDDFAAGTRMNELAQEQGFLVLYPAQGPRSNNHRCWNWFEPAHQRRGAGEPAVLAAIVRRVLQELPVDRQRVYVAGLSAGGAMAAILGNEYPDLFAAVGVHSGLPQGAAHDVASAFAAMKGGPQGTARPRTAAQVPTIVFHGDHDATVSPRNGELLMVGRTPSEPPIEGRANGRGYSRTVYRDEAGRLQAEHWLVEGAGHAWSGGSPAGSFAEAHGPDASREMLRFFNEQRLR